MIFNFAYDPTIVRETAILFNGLMIMTVLIYGLDLFLRYKRADAQTRDSDSYTVFLLIAILLLGLSAYSFVSHVDLFYRFPVESSSYIFLNRLRMLLIPLLVVPFPILMERKVWGDRFKIQLPKMKVSVFWIIFALLMLLLIGWTILSFSGYFTGSMTQYLLIAVPFGIAIAIFGIAGAIGFYFFIHDYIQPLESEKHLLSLSVYSAIFVLVGGSMTSYGRQMDYDLLYLMGYVVRILAWLGSRHFLLKIGNYSELEWKSGIVILYIFTKQGLGLYSRTFDEMKQKTIESELQQTLEKMTDQNEAPALPETTKQPIDKDLVAGGMIGITTMLSEITQQRAELSSLKIGDRYLISGQGGNWINVILVAEKDLGVYYSLTRELTQKIEAANPNLEKFNGNLSTLTIEPFVDEIFWNQDGPQAEGEE